MSAVAQNVDLDSWIAVATRHVVDGRLIVERQRKRVASDPSNLDAVLLLETLEQSLVIFERDLDNLLLKRSRK